MLSRNFMASCRALQRLPSRSFHPSMLHTEEATEAAATPKIDTQQLKEAARNFNTRRASYRRQVSKLRKDYADQVAQQRAADLAEEEAQRKAATRKRLERQRRKNIRSAQNALRQEEIRKQREKEFKEHLEAMQRKREETNERYTRARQKVADELEKVAHLWLTTPEEVEAAFTMEAEQLLWSYPGGVLGEPNPSLDAHFWQNETHTWQMARTYQSQRAMLLEKIEEKAYSDANIISTFWTEKRQAERKQLEEKARLRAMVKASGERELLRRQQLMMEELNASTDEGLPQKIKAPSNQLLRNERAQESEGAKLLLEDPTQFFVFDDDGRGASTMQTSEESANSGLTLGSPVGLRDPLRRGSSDSVFPQVLGKFIKPDMRTEREKKQQEREQRLLAAAQAEAQDVDIDLAAEQQTAEDLEPDLDYDNNDWDSDDEEWVKGLDPIADREILETPKDKRFSEADIDWVMEQLDGRLHHFEQQFKQEVEELKQRAQTESVSVDGSSSVGELEQALLSLSEEQLILLSDLDENHEKMSAEEISETVLKIGLSESDVESILQRDR